MLLVRDRSNKGPTQSASRCDSDRRRAGKAGVGVADSVRGDSLRRRPPHRLCRGRLRTLVDLNTKSAARRGGRMPQARTATGWPTQCVSPNGVGHPVAVRAHLDDNATSHSRHAPTAARLFHIFERDRIRRRPRPLSRGGCPARRRRRPRTRRSRQAARRRSGPPSRGRRGAATKRTPTPAPSPRAPSPRP